MAREITGWNIIEPKCDNLEDMKGSLDNLMRNCGYTVCKTFLKNVNNGALDNKKDIIDKIGGVETYAILSQIVEPSDEQYYTDFIDKINELIWQVVPNWYEDITKQENEVRLHKDLKRLRDVILNFKQSDEKRIGFLKEYWSDFEYVSRLRSQLPKISKVVANILEYLLKKHNLYSEYSKHIPIILNTLGSVKKRQYIVVLSTTPSAIYSASVSEYFDSCYDIRSGGHAYASSVCYLAQDDKVAVLKVFEYNEENREKLDMGIGVLSSSKNALARRFVFLHKSKNDNKTILTLGKSYPNASILDGIFLGKELYTLLIDNISKDELSTHKLEESEYVSKITYSKWFRGYEDLIEKGGIVISHKEMSEDTQQLEDFSTMVVADKGLYQIDTGLFVKYTSNPRNIGFMCDCDDEY
jgi:hypothetical protein